MSVSELIKQIEEEIATPEDVTEPEVKAEVKPDGSEREEIKKDQDVQTESTACEASGHGMPNMDDFSRLLKKVESLEAQVGAGITREQFDRHNYTVTEVDMGNSPTMLEEDLTELTNRGMSALGTYGTFNFNLALGEDWIGKNAGTYNEENMQSAARLEEAITYTAGSAPVGNRIAITDRIRTRPGGKYLRSIRNLVYFSQLGTGTVQVTRPYGEIPDAVSKTEGTNNSLDTHELTNVELTANPVTGVTQFIKQADLENTPQQLFEHIANTGRAEVLNFEANMVFNTAIGAVADSALGGIVNGKGEPITDDDSDQLGTLGFEALVQTVAEFQNRGYDTGFGQLKFVCHPYQLAQLKKDADLQRYLQQGDAVISRTGNLTYFQGMEIIPMNILQDSGDAGSRSHDVHRGYAFVNGYTLWLASKRNMTINILQKPREIGYDWSWTQRKNATVFDPLSLIRVASNKS